MKIDFQEFLKLRIPEAKIEKYIYHKEFHTGDTIIFNYKGVSFSVEKVPFGGKFSVIPINKNSNKFKEDTKISNKLMEILNKPINIEDYKQITKKIRDTSTKLPKKKLKLEDVGNDIDGFKEALKERLPEANFIKVRKYSSGKNNSDVVFSYENKKYIGGKIDDKIFVYATGVSGSMNKAEQLEVLLNTPTIKDTKKITKEIRQSATKLPKKKLRLESVLNESTQEFVADRLKKRLPGVTNIKLYKSANQVGFNFKGVRFRAWIVKGIIFFENYFREDITEKKLYEIKKEIRDFLNTLSRKEVIEKTKKIRDTSTKLPKKKLKLEDAVEERMLTVKKEIKMTKEAIKKKVPKAKIIKIDNYYGDVVIKYKELEFTVRYVNNKFIVIPTLESIGLEAEVEDRLNVKDIKDVKQITKQIRDTAIKLPKKKLKLEDLIDG